MVKQDSRRQQLERLVRRATGASSVSLGERVQSLWSGYGQIVRVELAGVAAPSVIVKQVSPPSAANHPRGWATDRSHERKLRSYAVEMKWYQDFSERACAQCRLPTALACQFDAGQWLFVLEDLDAAGFGLRRQQLSQSELLACLRWLARLHAAFLGTEPKGLWRVGSYWHLATRPDELKKMTNAALRQAAAALDQRLNGCRFKTLIHGDAKLANFCFASSEAPIDAQVAGVDFQYVGGGCGIKDVAYFISSLWDEHECEANAPAALDSYFEQLRQALQKLQPDIEPAEVEAEWRELYPIAWADFTRFLDGWAPGHYKLHDYSLGLTEQALRSVSGRE